MSQITKFHLSNEIYVVFNNNLETYPNSLLYMSTNENFHHDLFYKDIKENIIYINRNPEYFKYIVSYLRSELYIEDIAEMTTKETDQLIIEAKFYNFEILVAILEDKQKTNNIMDTLIDISDNEMTPSIDTSNDELEKVTRHLIDVSNNELYELEQMDNVIDQIMKNNIIKQQWDPNSDSDSNLDLDLV
jgi:hypothetical protein